MPMIPAGMSGQILLSCKLALLFAATSAVLNVARVNKVGTAKVGGIKKATIGRVKMTKPKPKADWISPPINTAKMETGISIKPSYQIGACRSTVFLLSRYLAFGSDSKMLRTFPSVSLK